MIRSPQIDSDHFGLRNPPPLVAPCISQLPVGVKPAKVRTRASPSLSGVVEPVFEHGAACVRLSECPNSRKGRSSPHLQGRVMDEPRRVTTCVGIDVSKDRLDVHVLPTGEAFAVARDGKGLERLGTLEVSLIVLEATGGFETTVAAALASAVFRSRSSTRARSEASPRRSASS